MFEKWDNRTWIVIIVILAAVVVTAMVLGRDFDSFYNFFLELLQTTGTNNG